MVLERNCSTDPLKLQAAGGQWKISISCEIKVTCLWRRVFILAEKNLTFRNWTNFRWRKFLFSFNWRIWVVYHHTRAISFGWLVFHNFQFWDSQAIWLWDLKNPKRLMEFQFCKHNHEILALGLPGVYRWDRFGHWLNQNQPVGFGRSIEFRNWETINRK